MSKLILAPIFLILACVLAGIYGGLHNQISYSVSPEYFHDFKFRQFRIETQFQNRIGAAIVGWRASWWMGLYLGVPLGFLALFIHDPAKSLSEFIKTALIVLIITFATGLIALVISFFTVYDDQLLAWTERFNLIKPVRFARAGTMNCPGFTGEFLVQNLCRIFCDAQVLVKTLLCFLWRDVADLRV